MDWQQIIRRGPRCGSNVTVFLRVESLRVLPQHQKHANDLSWHFEPKTELQGYTPQTPPPLLLQINIKCLERQGYQMATTPTAESYLSSGICGCLPWSDAGYALLSTDDGSPSFCGTSTLEALSQTTTKNVILESK